MERKLKVLTLKVKDKPDTNEAELIIILREHTNSEGRTSLGTLSTTHTNRCPVKPSVIAELLEHMEHTWSSSTEI